ncbi:MAG: cytochrome-c oxidase, cbb3-type subunit III [Alphaproteobacteria bacterium]|nr:cytochrome-c oxidase, cbb3-type subunit III [Alphaproteobacteria bacterium]MBV9694459.1 cytochrome-c oxidase, cbb3-type subunit III [Alphaproteobacteria bacterium]
MSERREIDGVSGTETTGHEWDGIKELDTPMPRWWLGIFYATIVWAAGYWVVMPAWPTLSGYTHGLLDHSQRDEVMANVRALQTARAAKERALTKASLAQIQSDPDLLQFAMAEGRTAFGDNCVPCHGSGGQGAHGYPNLNDDAWLWGGKLEDIQHTITVGVRSTSPDTRQSEMPAFGRDGILKPEQVDDLTEFVVHLSQRPADGAAVRRATKLFADNCAQCHGALGAGDRKVGAPNLTDNDWLYGSSREDIHDQIWNGHGGVMPTWQGRLTPETIKSLAVYVHSLGGGE